MCPVRGVCDCALVFPTYVLYLSRCKARKKRLLVQEPDDDDDEEYEEDDAEED